MRRGKPIHIVVQILVKPFYRENAGTFVFIFIMMFFIVGELKENTPANYVGIVAYHYSLIMGMLQNLSFLGLVLLLWLFYGCKCAGFVRAEIQKPQNAFLQIVNTLPKGKRFRLFWAGHLLLLLPILGYAVFIVKIGLTQHLYGSTFLVVLFLLLLSWVPAINYVQLLEHLGKEKINLGKVGFVSARWFASYPMLLLRYVAREQKALWVGIKVFTCGLVFLIARNNTSFSYDTSFPFLFFSFGVLSSGVLIYRIRTFEETYLAFYRGLGLSLFRRFLYYALVYFLLFVPEALTLFLLTPTWLHSGDALRFLCCGYSLLLFMNSFTFLQASSMKDYMALLLVLFGIQYMFLISVGLTFLPLFSIKIAVIAFVNGYYRYNHNT